jgi:hypothetical protein
VEKHKKLPHEDTKRGFRLVNFDGTQSPTGKFVTKIFLKDTTVNGVLRRQGEVKYTWEHMADNTVYTYDIGRCDPKKYRTPLLGLKSSKLPIPSRKMRIEDGEGDQSVNPYSVVNPIKIRVAWAGKEIKTYSVTDPNKTKQAINLNEGSREEISLPQEQNHLSPADPSPENVHETLPDLPTSFSHVEERNIEEQQIDEALQERVPLAVNEAPLLAKQDSTTELLEEAMKEEAKAEADADAAIAEAMEDFGLLV